MKKLYLALAVAALPVLTACNNDTAGPSDQLDLVSSFVLNGGFAYGVDGGLPGRGLPELRRLEMLPDSIALTTEQETEINALLETFQTAYQSQLDALNSIHEQAHTARENGATRDEMQAILMQADTIRALLIEPLGQLRDAINAVLTDAQKAWLTDHQYRRCDPTSAAPLTAEQQAQIQALRDAFMTANQADLDAVKAAHDAARAAREDGQSKAEVDAILATVADAMERLHSAGQQLRADIDAVLTPEQRASNCFGRGVGPMGGPGMEGPHGRGGPGHREAPGW